MTIGVVQSQEDPLLEKVRILFQKACLARKKGREEEVAGLMRQILPESIREWSRGVNQTRDQKKSLLSELFRKEADRVETAWLAHILTLDEVASRTAMDAGSPAPIKVLPPLDTGDRIPLSDVAGMIDHVLMSQRQNRLTQREENFFTGGRRRFNGIQTVIHHDH